MRTGRNVLLVFAAWTAVGLFFLSGDQMLGLSIGRPHPLGEATRVYLTCAYIWFLFTPLIVLLSRRFRLLPPHVFRSIAVHVVAGPLFAVAGIATFAVLAPFVVGGPFATKPFSVQFPQQLAVQLHTDFLRYLAVVAIEHVLAASQLRAELAEARLEALRHQLHPHFLFNTLNSISVLMFEDREVANRMLLRLSDLLRSVLASDAPHEIPLGDELKFLERYLEIERMRFGDRLTVEMHVDPGTAAARVPNLILQPLVENAIRYGVAAVDRPATVSIRAEAVGRELHLQVRDDGPGMPKDAKRGVGLTNTIARLKQLYGNAQRLELSTPDGGGVTVSIAIPFR